MTTEQLVGEVAFPSVDPVDDLLRRCSLREPMLTEDSKSGSTFERLIVDGQRLVVKHLNVADDWIMRATGDLACRPWLIWNSGLLRRLPGCIDPAMVACQPNGLGRATLVMRDVADYLVPEGDEPISGALHSQFLDHMAMLHSRFWGWQDSIGLVPLENRLLEFAPGVAEMEAGRGTVVPTIIGQGWRRFEERVPSAATFIFPLLADPTPLAAALRTTPQTFIHGDWKLGNIGLGPEGRTILLDWAMPGEAPAALELAWYLALNRARLPQTKEDCIAEYAAGLARHGTPMGDWWSKQLDLALLTGLVWFGWEKALGETGELEWWVERAERALRWLP